MVKYNTYLCLLLITFANSLGPDQARQNVGPDLDPNCLTLWWYSWNKFSKRWFWQNSADDKFPVVEELSIIHTGGSAAPEAAGAGSTTLDRSFDVVCDWDTGACVGAGSDLGAGSDFGTGAGSWCTGGLGCCCCCGGGWGVGCDCTFLGVSKTLAFLITTGSFFFSDSQPVCRDTWKIH